MNNLCSPSAKLVAKIYVLPPSFNFNFFRNCSADIGKFRTAILADFIEDILRLISFLFIDEMDCI